MSASQYPEHLNPFAEDPKPKSSLKISNSFRELTRSLRKSFRIKKKDRKENDVEVRQKPTNDFRRIPVSYHGNEEAPIALPRSRFHERLTMPRPYYHHPTEGTSINNPFEDHQDTKVAPPKKRGKKRAPLPPKSISSQNVNESHQQHSSNWSLTSADTDISCSTDNFSEQGYITDTDRLSMSENFVDFNKEMEKLNNETNNNVTTKDQVNENKEAGNIPDLVISCPNSDTDSIKRPLSEDQDVEEKKLETEDTTKDEIDKDSNSDGEIIVRDITEDLKNPEGTEEPFLYHENKSLYIAGSTDELNNAKTYTGSVSLYIAGSKEELDHCNNNVEVNEHGEEDLIPAPKQRKNKLSKSCLLGTSPP